LEGAVFGVQTNLEEAWLVDGHLQVADFRDSCLEGARLNRAHLEGANLGKVTRLTRDQLAKAFGNEDTRLPPDLQGAPIWLVS
jgi:uncharacterized protein YjbI with pentapeptide repeats